MDYRAMLNRFYHKFLTRIAPENAQKKMWQSLENKVVQPIDAVIGHDSLKLAQIKNSDDFTQLIFDIQKRALPNYSGQLEDDLANHVLKDSLKYQNGSLRSTLPASSKTVRWLNSVANQITKANHLSFKPKITVIQTDVVDAYSSGRGRVVLSTGLLKTLKTEAEVAGVIAHELSHALHQDTLKQLIQNSIFARIGKILPRFTPEMQQQKKIVLDTLLKAEKEIHHQLEFDADSKGLELMNAAGFNPHSYKIALSRLDQSSKKKGLPPSPQQTHPSTWDRKEAIKNHIKNRSMVSAKNKETGAKTYKNKLENKNLAPYLWEKVLWFLKRE
jgi:hypothetical protein